MYLPLIPINHCDSALSCLFCRRFCCEIWNVLGLGFWFQVCDQAHEGDPIMAGKKRGGRRDVFVGFSFCSTCGVYNFRDVGVRFLLVVLFFGGSEFSILILGALWKTWNDERLLSCTNPRNQSWGRFGWIGRHLFGPLMLVQFEKGDCCLIPCPLLRAPTFRNEKGKD